MISVNLSIQLNALVRIRDYSQSEFYDRVSTSILTYHRPFLRLWMLVVRDFSDLVYTT